jgi:hypothetical protein
MKNLINKLKIQNFKSLEKVEIDCARINIIIGKPNVGKSNALEAISLLGGAYSQNEKKYLSEFIRYKKFRELFSAKGNDDDIIVQSDIAVAQMRAISTSSLFDFMIAPDLNTLKKWNDLGLITMSQFEVENLLQSSRKGLTNLTGFYQTIHNSGSIDEPLYSNKWLSPVKKFDFKRDHPIDNLFNQFLLPPYGNNLYAIVKNDKKLTKDVSGFFKEYKLKFVFKEDEKEFGLQREKNGVVFSYSYESMADTLQRIIFNIAAIRSNKNSVLLFEEPEAHSFPLYIKKFAEEVIVDKHNQYFITTHSPFILNTVIENAPLSDVKVFVATYNNYQTKLTALTQKELEEMLNNGNDIFFSEKLNG